MNKFVYYFSVFSSENNVQTEQYFSTCPQTPVITLEESDLYNIVESHHDPIKCRYYGCLSYYKVVDIFGESSMWFLNRSELL